MRSIIIVIIWKKLKIDEVRMKFFIIALICLNLFCPLEAIYSRSSYGNVNDQSLEDARKKYEKKKKKKAKKQQHLMMREAVLF